MRPPLLGLFPKVVPEGGDNFHGKFIPAGTCLCMNTSSLLRSAAIFGSDSDVYRPERFMDLEAERRIEMQRDVELAFGYGQNQCAGKQVVFTEINKSMFEVRPLVHN
jgi:cytochrome P450